MTPFLEFRTCAGCGEMFPIRSILSRKAKWCSQKCRKGSYGDPCIDCGARTAFGAERARVPEPRCAKCAAVARRNDELAEQVIELRREGLLNHQIAERLGTSPHVIGNLVYRLRNRGIDVPKTAYRPGAARAVYR